MFEKWNFLVINILDFCSYRYLKSVFPKAEETLLLDILANSDNNVQKATEKLIAMGFEKRDTPPPKLTLKKKEEEKQKAVSESQSIMPTPPPRMKSLEEKQKSRFIICFRFSYLNNMKYVWSF